MEFIAKSSLNKYPQAAACFINVHAVLRSAKFDFTSSKRHGCVHLYKIISILSINVTFISVKQKVFLFHSHDVLQIQTSLPPLR